jgi:signal peptidase II
MGVNLKLGRKHWVIILVSPLMVIADQFSKLVIHSYMHVYDSVTVIQGHLNIYYVQNSGLVFGLFADQLAGAATWVYLGINIAALAIIVHLFSQTKDKAVLFPLALSLVLAGALGNLIDRLHWGYVVDFVQIYYVSKSPPHLAHSWGIFNIADLAISSGIAFLIIDSFRPQREDKPKPEPDKPESSPAPGA